MKDNQEITQAGIILENVMNDDSQDIIDLSSERLTNQDVTLLCKILRKSSHVNTVILLDCSLNKLQYIWIEDAMKHNKSVTEFQLQTWSHDKDKVNPMIENIQKMAKDNSANSKQNRF